MFIIFGSPRSGTTLLGTTLSLHPALQVIDQTDFIVPWAFVLDRVKDADTGRHILLNIISSSRYFPVSIGRYLNQSEIKQILFQAPYELSGLLNLIYGAIAGKCEKAYCGDKSVSDIGYFPILNRVGLFQSDIKYIHIVRDIRAVFASLERLDWVKDRHIYPRSWANANLGLHEILVGRDNYCFIRYEEMVSNPRNTFSKLCEFLGFSYDRCMENHAVRGLEYINDSHHADLQKPFLTESIDKWRKSLPDNMIRCCETQAAEALYKFGYTSR